MTDILAEMNRTVQERRAREQQSLRLERRWHEAQEWCAWAFAELNYVRERVRAEHQPFWNEGFNNEPWQQCSGCLQDYPCLTVRALESPKVADA